MSDTCCSHESGDRHNWNCTLTPIFAQLYWDTDPAPEIRRSPGFRLPRQEWNLVND